jgi:hypothetical protein
MQNVLSFIESPDVTRSGKVSEEESRSIPFRTGLHQALGVLPLFHQMEERAGERRTLLLAAPLLSLLHHSFLAERGMGA